MSEKYAKRFEAVFLCTHSKGPKLSYAAAAKVIKKSKKFVVMWNQRYKVYKNVDDFSERGLKRVTTKKQDKVIVQLFKRDHSLRLRQARTILAKKGIDVSINTIERRLKEANISYRPTSSKPLLSEKHIEKRKDNDPKHRSRLCKAWKQENGVTVMDWPSQSPDANPIENVWGIMKTHLAGKPVHDLKQLVRQVRKIWSSLSTSYAEKLVQSMPRRCQAILDNDGDYTAY